jgi:hypothetical protein
MKKHCFSGLIFCGLLLAAAQTNGQNFEQNGDPVTVTSSPDNAGLLAYAENNIVILRWSGSNEENIVRYIVEHSTDGVHFTPLHEVVSKGPFTQIGNNAYQDADTYPSSAVNFYRVQAVLREGGSLYTSVAEVDMDMRNRPILQPTVIARGGTLWLTNYTFHDGRPLTVNLFNGRGTLLGSWLVNGTSFNINTYRLGKGFVFYRISDPARPLITAGKILIQ